MMMNTGKTFSSSEGKKKKKRERIDYAKELETLAQTKQRKHKSRNASWLVQQSGIQAEKD